MGIQGLLPFLKKSSRNIQLSEFRGKVAAVDVYCWLHKGAFSCAEKLVKGEPTDGYIIYVMKQVNLLLSHNIKPILVFDGCHLPAKEVTELKRRENRVKNRRKAKELLREGKIKEARECFQRCVDITSTMAHEVIKACRARNIDTIVAPYEADSQLAFLNLNGVADIVITEDSDLILFGCSKIIFKMDSNGCGVLVEKEKLHLSMNVPRDKFDFTKFRNMCILSGCDYLPSLHGIGLVKACRFFIVTSNPDVYTALCKLPVNLKMPQLEVTLEYRENFMKAINTLLHQLVFDPLSHTLKPLTPYPQGIGHEDMPYCGPFFGHERAYQIALGNVDVQTGETVDDFDPLNFKRPEMKSSGWGQKGDVVCSHPSIWDANFETLITNWQESFKEKESGMRGKKCSVDVPIIKRKINVVVKEDDGLSEDMLENLYTSKKVKLESELGKSSLNIKGDESAETSEFVNSNSKTPEKVTESDDDLPSVVERNAEEDVSVTDEKNIDKLTCVLGTSNTDSSTSNSTNEDIGTNLCDKEDCASFGSQSPNIDDVKEKSLVASTLHRNPFAKKSFPESENLNPFKLKKFSALKSFSASPMVVRSRYFRTDDNLDDTASERSSVNKSPEKSPVVTKSSPKKSALSIESSSIGTLKENSNTVELAEDNFKVDNFTPERKQLKSPLKPKNEIVETEVPKCKRVKSSFNWNNFSFTSKDRVSNFSNQISTQGGTRRLGSVSNIPFETPPSSQNSQEILKTPEFKVSNSRFGFSTPEENVREDHIVGRIETPKRTPSEKRYPSKKCRVSGLKKLQGSVGNERQLNLKDMFSFKKDVSKL
ncbi:UNVERIFIED_CONTAM: hypothetical protein RMT77_003881 [Armadillidium vulgare]